MAATIELSDKTIRQIAEAVAAEIQGSRERTFLTPPQVAKQLGVEPAKIIAWIQRGELKASNVADREGGRPRWRIAAEALDDFLSRRQAIQPPPRTHRKRRSQPADIIEYV